MREVMIRVSPECRRKLTRMALKRSAEIGRRVTMGFIIEEIITALEQLENPEERTGEFFGAHD